MTEQNKHDLGILKLIFSLNFFLKSIQTLGHNGPSTANITAKRQVFLWTGSPLFGNNVRESQPVFMPLPHLLSNVFSLIPLMLSSYRHSSTPFLSSHKFLKPSASSSELAHLTRLQPLSCSLKPPFPTVWSVCFVLDA